MEVAARRRLWAVVCGHWLRKVRQRAFSEGVASPETDAEGGNPRCTAKAGGQRPPERTASACTGYSLLEKAGPGTPGQLGPAGIGWPAARSTLRAGQRRVQFGGQADQRETITKGRLEVPSPETLQENEGQKQREHEIDDRRRFVLEDVVQAPMGRSAVEAAVLDVPTPVAGPPEVARATAVG